MNEMEILFDEWRKEIIINESHFVEDGIVCPEIWNKAERKVLFILKETNNYKKNIAKLIHDVVTKKSKSGLWVGATFHNIGRWSYGLLNYKNDAPPYKIADKNRKNALLSCSFINIKKTTGGRTATQAVEEHAEKYAHFLRRQISILSPDVIVFGGTYDLVKKYVIPELTGVSPRIHKFGSIICINANHPACTIKRTVIYDQVISSFDDFVKSNSCNVSQ